MYDCMTARGVCLYVPVTGISTELPTWFQFFSLCEQISDGNFSLDLVQNTINFGPDFSFRK